MLATLTNIQLLAAALPLFSVGIGLADVAVNVQGKRVEQAGQETVMSVNRSRW